MSFDRLATVELQLIMQCCDQRTLLRLARCSRFTLSAASHPFAWRCVGLVAISSAARPDPSALRLVWQSLRSAGSPAAESPTSPLAVLRGSLLRHADADLLLRCWTGTMTGDHTALLAAARITLASLPRLRSLDFACRVVNGGRQVASLLLPALSGLTALDIAVVTLLADHVRALVQQLPRLRTLRCWPAGEASDCLLPLVQLQLTDLGIVTTELQGRFSLAEEVFAECRGLRRLALSDNFDLCKQLLLRPAVRRLQELTLAHSMLAGDWPSICANLSSIRRLTLDRCTGAGQVLRAVAAGGCPQLRLVRMGMLVLDDERPLKAQFHLEMRIMAVTAAISLLLERRPEVRVELRVGFERAGVSASWLLPLLADCDWMSVTPQWTDFELLQPLRHRVRRWPLLFADSELGCESPTDPEGIEEDLAD